MCRALLEERGGHDARPSWPQSTAVRQIVHLAACARRCFCVLPPAITRLRGCLPLRVPPSPAAACISAPAAHRCIPRAPAACGHYCPLVATTTTATTIMTTISGTGGEGRQRLWQSVPVTATPPSKLCFTPPPRCRGLRRNGETNGRRKPQRSGRCKSNRDSRSASSVCVERGVCV